MTVNSLQAADRPLIQMETSLGTIEIELNPEKAPLSVANFLRYTNEGFYDGTIFHRVIKNFMIQGGGFTTDFDRKNTHPPIDNEAFNGLKNDRGTIAMARTNDPHSGTSQFFINTVDNNFLNFQNKSMRGWGYAVFGKVTRGMDVVDRIQNVSTGPAAFFPSDVPQQQVIITKVTQLNVQPKDTPANKIDLRK
ncbi:MAG: peptidylprolyl isomerase [Gammaproteobacteria bacterium]|nr:peptidylprolyl isomerase [Gammaproteobacteria bacterium]